MAELLQKIGKHREAILLGELGALLHMFGKCSSEFLLANSRENQALPQNQRVRDSHQDLKHLPNLKPYLEDSRLTEAFAFSLGGKSEKLAGNFTDFIQKYSRCPTCNGINPAQCSRCKGKSPDSPLIWLLNTCHRMTSADEKGVVRRTQSKDDMRITTPFGYRVQTIDLSAIDAVRKTMDSDFAKALADYLQERAAIDTLHDQAVRILSKGMSRALGETRKPANDVTLWAQSYGVASLFKPVLATLAMDLEPCPKKRSSNDLDYDNIHWRLFGIGWNGLNFIERGRKPGDILKRQEILGAIGTEIQKLLEDAHPVGNRFYGDLNGLFFTFPGIADTEATSLIKELAPALVQIVRGRSANELWPFFTLSKPRRTLTAITKEIEKRDRIATAPKVAASLFMEQGSNGRSEKLLVSGPTLTAPEAGQDICPVCQIRSKLTGDEACCICRRDRRSGRQEIWQQERKGRTIWIDEVADQNNRVALLTVRFDLSRWLSSEWLTTIWSQTLQDWAQGKRLYPSPGKVRRQLEELDSKNAIKLPNMDHYSAAKSFADWVLANPTKTECKPVLEAFLEEAGGTYEVSGIPQLLREVGDTYGAQDSESLLKFFFTQNPSPARLARIWEETETFLDLWLTDIKAETFAIRPQRLAFTTVSRISEVCEGQTYRIVVPNLAPGPLTILCLNESQQDFLTVDSLEKFQFKNGENLLRGLAAVQCALEKMGIESWEDEATGRQLTGIASLIAVQEHSFQTEPYLPFIVLARSPVYYQVLFPANQTPDMLRRLLALANERFSLVEGKLPLHVGLLVTKRKFPLYALIEAGQQMLDDASFQKKVPQVPWWDTVTHATDPFYGQYPRVTPNDSGYKLSDLTPVNNNQVFVLTPGYFDFDFLGSTADRHNLTYERRDDRLVRSSVAYGALRPRPFTMHRLQELLRVWDILAAHLGPTQRHHLGEALSTKLEEWETVDWEAVRPIFNRFSKALLRRTFTEKKWAELSQKQRVLLEQSANNGLLLEALELFQHVLKEEPSNG